MNRTIDIGIIGDFDEKKTSHTATMNAIEHAAGYLSIKTKVTWLPTPSFLKEEAPENLKQYDCIWVSSGAPYKSMEGAIQGIRRAREIKKPLIGT